MQTTSIKRNVKLRLSPFAMVTLALVAACSLIDVPPTAIETTARESAAPSDGACVTAEKNGYLNLERLRVANWNVYKGKRDGWHAEITDINHVDTLFLMQEAPHHEALHTSLGEQQDWRFAPGYHTGEVQTGVLTSAGVAPTLLCQLQHREPWLGTPKASLITRYPIADSGEALIVANIHAINFTLGTRAFARQISDVTAILREHEGPLILAGDFNTWNKRRLRIIHRQVSALGLQAVGFESKHVKRFLGYPLDHIFYRDLKLRQKSVRSVDSSDHNMLLAHFSI